MEQAARPLEILSVIQYNGAIMTIDALQQKLLELEQYKAKNMELEKENAHLKQMNEDLRKQLSKYNSNSDIESSPWLSKKRRKTQEQKDATKMRQNAIWKAIFESLPLIDNKKPFSDEVILKLWTTVSRILCILFIK